jgi:CBS-domain-containing membrane protein
MLTAVLLAPLSSYGFRCSRATRLALAPVATTVGVRADLGGIIGAIIGTMIVLLVVRAARGRNTPAGAAPRR